jgi:hypothetical protein
VVSSDLRIESLPNVKCSDSVQGSHELGGLDVRRV